MNEGTIEVKNAIVRNMIRRYVIGIKLGESSVVRLLYITD